MLLRRKMIVFILKDIKRKSSIAVLALLIISSFYIGGFISSFIIEIEAEKYWHDQSWPADIHIIWWEYGNFSEIIEGVNDIEGVKWSVYPAGINFFERIKYGDKRYTLYVTWCNVEDPIFPSPKYIVEGEFFKSNNETSVILESIGKQLLIDIGEYKGLGENGTVIDLDVMNLTIAGIISNVLIMGREEAYLKLTNIIFVYVPLNTYLEIYETLSKNESTMGSSIDIDPTIYVKVEEGYDIEEVADRIRERYPGVSLETRLEAKRAEQEVLLRGTLYTAIMIYALSAAVMVWDIKNRNYEIAMLKAMGWRRRHMLELFVLRYVIFGLISGLAGLIVGFILSSLMLAPTLYYAYLFILYLPYQVLLTTTFTVLFSIPATIKAYNISAESVIRG